MNDGIWYRSLQPSDREQLKSLHEDWFPVRYTECFYDEVVHGYMGKDGTPTFSIVAIDSTGDAALPEGGNHDNQTNSAGPESTFSLPQEQRRRGDRIVGCVICQVVSASTCADKNLLLPSKQRRASRPPAPDSFLKPRHDAPTLVSADNGGSAFVEASADEHNGGSERRGGSCGSDNDDNDDDDDDKHYNNGDEGSGDGGGGGDDGCSDSYSESSSACNRGDKGFRRQPFQEPPAPNRRHHTRVDNPETVSLPHSPAPLLLLPPSSSSSPPWSFFGLFTRGGHWLNSFGDDGGQEDDEDGDCEAGNGGGDEGDGDDRDGGDQVMYVLTLGTAASHRRRGLAQVLLEQVFREASRRNNSAWAHGEGKGEEEEEGFSDSISSSSTSNNNTSSDSNNNSSSTRSDSSNSRESRRREEYQNLISSLVFNESRERGERERGNGRIVATTTKKEVAAVMAEADLRTVRAVYLHVITHNEAAIRFYKKNGFQRLREIPDYYLINERLYNCFLYIRYLGEEEQEQEALRGAEVPCHGAGAATAAPAMPTATSSTSTADGMVEVQVEVKSSSSPSRTLLPTSKLPPTASSPPPPPPPPPSWGPLSAAMSVGRGLTTLLFSLFSSISSSSSSSRVLASSPPPVSSLPPSREASPGKDVVLTTDTSSIGATPSTTGSAEGIINIDIRKG